MNTEKTRLDAFLKQKRLSLEKELAKGFSSRVFLVKKGKKNYALKVERDKSRRKDMLRKEVKNLRLANSAGIGPRLVSFSTENRCILMEYIPGPSLREWVFGKRKFNESIKVIRELLVQAQKLDSLGLSHGQLAGKGANIIVSNGRPVIIDFEKASSNRKSKNFSQLFAFLFLNPHGSVKKRVWEIIEKG